jgi:hypothetical protein
LQVNGAWSLAGEAQELFHLRLGDFFVTEISATLSGNNSLFHLHDKPSLIFISAITTGTFGLKC